MKRSSAQHLNCSIARALDVLGEWWTLLVVRHAFYGATRFEQFVTDLKISRNVLADRLETLVAHGVFERRRYQRQPDRFEYLLTDQGRDLFPVLVALLHWGDKWLSAPAVGGAPVVLRHRACGHDAVDDIRCGHCDQPISIADIDLQPGPGMSRDGERRVAAKAGRP